MKKQNNNLTLKMIGSLTEPDSLSFFPSWTAGENLKKLCSVHLLMILIIVASYIISESLIALGT